jgi:hypothetical protein
MTRRLAVVLVLLLCQVTAWAHKASDSYLMVDVKGQAVTAQWDIALRDIDFALGLDRDGNAEITWGELRARQSDVAAWALSRLTVSRGGVCPLGVTGLQVDDHTDGGYAVLHLLGECPGATGALGLEYRLLFDLDKLHRGLLRLTLDDKTYTTVLSPTSGVVQFGAAQASRWTQFSQYLIEGIWHIWIGFDHILFLVSLLLPAVLVLHMRRWQGVSSFGTAARDVLWVVTSFTAAHSITITLASLGLVSAPAAVVEPAIALSIAFVAIENLFERKLRPWRLAVVFVFGLVHGLGFAAGLIDIGMPIAQRTTGIIGFSFGVEAGHLAVLAAAFLLLGWTRGEPWYRSRVEIPLSIGIAVIACWWAVERMGIVPATH